MDEITTLLLSGGAMRGIAYVGAFKKLRKMINPKRVAGVSIGSAFGLLWILGYSYSELRESILTKSFKELHRFKVSNVMTEWGLDNGDGLRLWLTSFLEGKGFSENVTFKDLYNKTEITFGVFATDIVAHDLFLFDHNTTPDTLVLDAIMASMSIPFLFTCKKIRIENSLVPFVDGAVISNLPVAKLMELWDIEEDSLLALKLIDNSGVTELTSITEYILGVSRCISSHIHKEECKNMIKIDISNMPHLDLKMTKAQKRELIKRGYFSLS
jgi:predicted acylesterase/phospholipase RssA